MYNQISIKNAIKHVKQRIGGEPVHYRITFITPICNGVYFMLDYWFEDERFNVGFILRWYGF